MIFCQSARVHIPGAMSKSFGCVWVIRQKICEKVPARAQNQEEREEKKEVFVVSETHSKKNEKKRIKNLLFGCVFVFFLPPRASTNFDEFLFRVFIKASFFFSFFQPTWQKKDTRIHAQQNHRNNKSKEGHAREVKKKSAFVRFHSFLRRVSDS